MSWLHEVKIEDNAVSGFVRLEVNKVFCAHPGGGGAGVRGDPTTQQLLRQVEHRYNRAETLEVRFAETYSAPSRAARTETGTLYLRKPGRMRWEYTSPAGNGE